VKPLDPSSNRTRKFKRSTWQSGKETGGKPDLPVKNPEKNHHNWNRTRRGTKNSSRKLGGKTRKLGGETGETSISSRRNQVEFGLRTQELQREIGRSGRETEGEPNSKACPEPHTNPSLCQI